MPAPLAQAPPQRRVGSGCAAQLPTGSPCGHQIPHIQVLQDVLQCVVSQVFHCAWPNGGDGKGAGVSALQGAGGQQRQGKGQAAPCGQPSQSDRVLLPHYIKQPRLAKGCREGARSARGRHNARGAVRRLQNVAHFSTRLAGQQTPRERNSAPMQKALPRQAAICIPNISDHFASQLAMLHSD